MEESGWIDALRSPDGLRVLDELSRHMLVAKDELRLLTGLRQRYPALLVAAALVQAKLRVRARSKFTHAERMFFTRSGLEQASSERMARHHAKRFTPFRLVVDLCTGIGGDLVGLAEHRSVIAVDRDPAHIRLACLNSEANGIAANTTCVLADVRDLKLDSAAAVFVDPARRSPERRFNAGTSEPSLAWCLTLANRGAAVGIKAAPGLPTNAVPGAWELEFVSERRELKESVLWSPNLATTRRRATILPHALTLIEAHGAGLPVRPPGAYLLDPDPAVTRAGLVEDLGRTLDECWKIDDEIAFLSADFAMETPFGRTLRIAASMPWNLARLRDGLRALDVGIVDIRKRGSAVDVDDLQRRLRLHGTSAATVVLTRVSNRPWAFVCFPVEHGVTT